MGETKAIDFSLSLLLSGIVGMLLLAVALVLFFVIYQRRLLAQQLEARAEEQRHQLQLLSAAVEVQETERRRIARDLHDDIGSLLSAARLYLRQLSPDNDPSRNEAVKDEALGIMDEMIRNTRRITHDLLPAELEKFGFFAAAEDLCQRVHNTGAIVVTFRGNLERRLEKRQEIPLYRVLQELINNSLKHAEATQIEVTTEWRTDRFLFHYHDNGKGFSIPAGGYAGLGLKNIESRISLISGELQVVTAPGQGLEVHISLPLPILT